ncbi:Phosphatidylinositol (PI) 3-kinase [Batrachochytrium dendrobatidis]
MSASNSFGNYTGFGVPNGSSTASSSNASSTERTQISDFSYCLSSELDINVVFKM